MVVFVVITLETLAALHIARTRKNVHKCLERLLTPLYGLRVVPNQPHPDKAMLALRIPRALKARIEKAAKSRKMTTTDYVEWSLTASVRDVILTADDYRKIAEATAKATSSHRPDQRLRSSGAERKADEVGGGRAT